MAPRQGILITRTRIRPNQSDRLRVELREIDANPVLFDRLRATHFLRWVVVRAGCNEWLVLSSNFDGELNDHLAQVAALIRRLPNHIYGHCEAPPPQNADDEFWIKYLRRGRLQPDLFFNGALFRSIEQIRTDRAMWNNLQCELDEHVIEPPGPWPNPAAPNPWKVWPLLGWLVPNWREREVRTEIQRLVNGDNDLRQLESRRCQLPRRSGIYLLGRALVWGLVIPLLTIGVVIGVVAWATPWLSSWTVTSWLLAFAQGTGWEWAVAALLSAAILLTASLILGRPWRFGPALFRGLLVTLAVATLVLATQLGSAGIGLDLTLWRLQLWRLATAGYLVGTLVFGGMVVLTASVLLRLIMSEEEKEAVPAPAVRRRVRDVRPQEQQMAAGGQHILLRRRRDVRIDDIVVRREGRFVQNEVTHVAPVKRGRIRLVVLSNVLFAINLLSHHYFEYMLHLGRITSIHFGYWAILDPGPGQQKYLLFMTNYDGSFDQYLADFAKRGAHLGLNAIWSNCEGYPQTRNAFQGGAADNVEGFIDFGRVHQIETQVWYSAYRDLTVSQINRNSIVRKGLKGKMKPAETRAWVQLLASYGTRLA